MGRMSPDITENLLPLLHEGEQILDVGCGDASLLKQLSGHAFHLFGTDPAIRKAGATRQTLPGVPGEITLLSASAESLPFEAGFFDTVILQCVFSLCHPEEAACEVCRVLKSGGRLILSDLYTAEAESETDFSGSPLLARLWSKDHLEACLSAHFRLAAFQDLTPALTEMILSAIWDGDVADCASCSDLHALRRAGARYGLWIWEKPAPG